MTAQLDSIGLLKRLGDGNVEFVLIGGSAVIAHGSDLVTRDVDICASMADDNVVRIITALQDVNPRWLTRPDLPVIRPDSHHLRGLKNMYLRTDIGRLDVLGELPEVCSYDELARNAVMMDVFGTRCRVIDIDRLIAAKRVAGRDRDLRAINDLEAIKKERSDRPK
jgi:predicted nucleotidyltransferase